jgi:hypothetical protein
MAVPEDIQYRLQRFIIDANMRPERVDNRVEFSIVEFRAAAARAINYSVRPSSDSRFGVDSRRMGSRRPSPGRSKLL